jgi:hypothetical protein
MRVFVNMTLSPHRRGPPHAPPASHPEVEAGGSLLPLPLPPTTSTPPVISPSLPTIPQPITWTRVRVLPPQHLQVSPLSSLQQSPLAPSLPPPNEVLNSHLLRPTHHPRYLSQLPHPPDLPISSDAQPKMGFKVGAMRVFVNMTLSPHSPSWSTSCSSSLPPGGRGGWLLGAPPSTNHLHTTCHLTIVPHNPPTNYLDAGVRAPSTAPSGVTSVLSAAITPCAIPTSTKRGPQQPPPTSHPAPPLPLAVAASPGSPHQLRRTTKDGLQGA